MTEAVRGRAPAALGIPRPAVGGTLQPNTSVFGIPRLP